MHHLYNSTKKSGIFVIFPIFCHPFLMNSSISSRGGVEDTRLEAKDTKKKKKRGQGQSFRGHNLSRPRTGMLEAKAKDQEHSCKSSQKKKKGRQKVFQAISNL